MLRRILFSVLLLVLLCSCSSESSSIALVSGEGGELSIVEGETSILIKMDKDIVNHLCTLSSLPVADMVKGLMPDTKVYVVPQRVFERRERYIGLLMSQNDDENRVDVMRENYNILKDSALMDKLDLYSASFDGEMFAQIKGVDKTYEYDLSTVLMDADSWEEACSFFNDWKDMIVR